MSGPGRPVSSAVKPGGAGLLLRGAVVGYVAVLVAIPLAALVAKALSGGWEPVLRAVTSPVAKDALVLTFWTATLVAVLNALLGTATAWVLVRYRFPGRRFLASLVDLPQAIPTLVAGMMLVLLFGPQTALGTWLTAAGFPVAFAAPGVILALLFVTLPFVVRAVEPVLMELDPAEEEAAHTLGAGTWTTFLRVTFPALFPAIAYGVLQSFARALAEFGSIVVVSGNIPMRTLTAPVLVFSEVEAGRPQAAAAVSLVLLLASLGLSLGMRGLKSLGGRAHG